jgi:hypothetical protein
MNPVDLNEVLYPLGDGLSLENTLGNIVMLEYTGDTLLDLGNLAGIDLYNNDYIVLSISKQEDNKRYIYLKSIPIKENTV